MKLWVGRKTVAVVVVVVVVHYSTYNYSLLMLHTAHESRITHTTGPNFCSGIL